MLNERVGMLDAEGDVEEHLPGRYAARTPLRFAHEAAHLLVARPANPLLFGIVADGAADLRGAERPVGEVFDLVAKASRNPWREETHQAKGARRTLTELTRLRAETVP